MPSSRLARNAARYIEKRIRSVLAQSVSMSGQYELGHLACGWASTDGTLRILRCFESEGMHIVPVGGATFHHH